MTAIINCKHIQLHWIWKDTAAKGEDENSKKPKKWAHYGKFYRKRYSK